LLGALVNLRLSSRNLVLSGSLASTALQVIAGWMDTHHSQISKRPGILNILQCLLQVTQLLVHHALRLFSGLDSLRLERLNRLDLPAYIVCLRLKRVELLLDVVDDGLVFEDAAVVREVDGLRLFRENRDLAARVVVALLEVLEGGSGVAFETELCAELCPVELEGGAAL
jgi:hypothetical protein